MSPTPADVRSLLGYLNWKRGHVLGILDGLDDAALRRPVLPSAWTPVGLVHHLAVDVERFWFGAVFGAEPDAIASFDVPGDAWQVAGERPVAEVFDLYRAETARADALIGSADPGQGPRWWPGHRDDSPPGTLRDAIVHVLVETATHAGHLDAVRELIDGRQFLVMDGSS
ncbi:DinB family protein [Microbispora sp. RL4-1S]|uniref:DinB family protein n=1 Tax=Microbispora oryzae TaxID=2806554 RepID=A0A940WJL0_9ACTN|nr:DinB family protein [Microbispora oryzae]MBP2706909.1 DinB family protein [Microbispora oryzae]